MGMCTFQTDVRAHISDNRVHVSDGRVARGRVDVFERTHVHGCVGCFERTGGSAVCDTRLGACTVRMGEQLGACTARQFMTHGSDRCTTR